MGYGEYIGGGSVKWRVSHDVKTSPSEGSGTPKGGKGRDEGGAKSRMVVVVNGKEVANVDCDTARVVVLWGRDADWAPKPPAIVNDLDLVNVPKEVAIEKLDAFDPNAPDTSA
jgi:hypothetical protein